jgi:hypothetical protein
LSCFADKAPFDGEDADRVVVANVANELARYGEGGTGPGHCREEGHSAVGQMTGSRERSNGHSTRSGPDQSGVCCRDAFRPKRRAQDAIVEDVVAQLVIAATDSAVLQEVLPDGPVKVDPPTNR